MKMRIRMQVKTLLNVTDMILPHCESIFLNKSFYEMLHSLVKIANYFSWGP